MIIKNYKPDADESEADESAEILQQHTNKMNIFNMLLLNVLLFNRNEMNKRIDVSLRVNFASCYS